MPIYNNWVAERIDVLFSGSNAVNECLSLFNSGVHKKAHKTNTGQTFKLFANKTNYKNKKNCKVDLTVLAKISMFSYLTL